MGNPMAGPGWPAPPPLKYSVRGPSFSLTVDQACLPARDPAAISLLALADNKIATLHWRPRRELSQKERKHADLEPKWDRKSRSPRRKMSVAIGELKIHKGIPVFDNFGHRPIYEVCNDSIMSKVGPEIGVLPFT